MVCGGCAGKIGVYSANRVEWMLVIQAINRMSAITGELAAFKLQLFSAELLYLHQAESGLCRIARCQ